MAPVIQKDIVVNNFKYKAWFEAFFIRIDTEFIINCFNPYKIADYLKEIGIILKNIRIKFVEII